MNVQTEYQIILNTCPDQESATGLANALIDEGLAACVNIVAGLTSIYQWQGKRETATEVLLLIKTRSDLYSRVEARIKSLHPYELPEIISVPISGGLSDYLDWIDNSTGKL
ncbi:MAG TPA: divalent-cation tolerance protein CutA [Gammaproteobacteria bacterium]|nr:divalent-cation tolerance protein CutA [Gammaproteobacteria bacterium]